MTKRKVLRHIPAVGLSRKLGGKKYYLATTHKLKRKAQKSARDFRKIGYSARVVKAPKSWKNAKWFVYRNPPGKR